MMPVQMLPAIMTTILPLSLAVAVAAGCGGGTPPAKNTVGIDAVPPAMMETARRELPGIECTDAWVKQDGTRGNSGPVEIRGRARNGKVREVEIRPAGTVETIE